MSILKPPELTPGARRILDTASRLFYERGLQAVGVDTVAAESGVTKRTLYDRFGSKDALIVAYLQRRDASWWARWEDRLDSTTERRALTVFDAYREDADPSGRGCAFLNAAAELPPTHPGFRVIVAHKRRVRDRLEELIREERDDAAALADHIYLLVEGAISQQAIDGDAHRLGEAKEFAARLWDVTASTR
ncbi:TetR/AcrR family transcriptional regulator [Microbacterium sp. 179-I 3D4 NHS]|uniref:TetR/AcrR family transcriptional regulator n=1 Tax=Microbacterium sp. 179-I 3D4 NHS TaxID=3142381 RepID=UPI0039A155CD